MTYRVDYNAITAQKTAVGKHEALEREIAKCDYVCLTDAIVSMNAGGAMVFEYLEKEEKERLYTGNPRKFKLRVLRDEWGNEPKPGDKVVRKIERQYRDKAGRKLRINHIHDLQRRGLFEKDFVIRREFEVDEKGCIECLFDDAGHFLLEFGKHFESGMAICGRKELSGGPCRAPDGSMKHVWYWRFDEAPPWVYDKLPSLVKRKRRTKAEMEAARSGDDTEDGQQQGADE